MSNAPSYIVYICANCVAVRHFKRENDSNIYRCHICGFEVSYDNGAITTIGIPKTFTKTKEPEKEPMISMQRKIRNYHPEGLLRNPYGRRRKPK